MTNNQAFPFTPAADRFMVHFYYLWAVTRNCCLTNPFERQVREADNTPRNNRRTAIRCDDSYRRMWRFRGATNSMAVR